MTNEKIAVIVPVYKTEKYVAECIESILNQTYTNFRLILVDDGTPDNAGKICDEYAKKDNRITVIHQENAGVTRARAAGVETADDCEWVTFVDSDDMITDNFLQEMSDLTRSNVDIVLCTSYYTETSAREPITDCNFEELFDIIEFRKRMASIRGGMPWGRLFRKKLIDTHVFNIPRDVFYGEDAIMNLRIAFNTEKNIAVANKPLYFYRQETQGVCNSFHYTPEYFEILRIHFLKSIPQEKFEVYKEAYLRPRIWYWRTYYNNSYCVDWSGTPYHKNLIDDIKRYKYRLSLFDKLLLTYTNPIIRFFIINTRKGLNLIKRLV